MYASILHCMGFAKNDPATITRKERKKESRNEPEESNAQKKEEQFNTEIKQKSIQPSEYHLSRKNASQLHATYYYIVQYSKF